MTHSSLLSTANTAWRPLNDPARLEAVLRDGFADGAPRRDLGWAANLARRALSADAALLTLLDADRQHFLSQEGLPSTGSALHSTPVWRSLGGVVVERNAPLVVHDTANAPPFADHSACAAFGVVSYAGVPVRSHDGPVLGALCVLGWTPRCWTADDLADLEALARIVQHEIESSALSGRSISYPVRGLPSVRRDATAQVDVGRFDQIAATLLPADLAVTAGPFTGLPSGDGGRETAADPRRSRTEAPRRSAAHPAGLTFGQQLTAGLEAGHFALHYQPIVALHSGAVTAYESLLRWKDPDRGLIPPARFLPAAERFGLMAPLTRFVVRAACTQLAAWSTRGDEIPLSINASPREILDTDLAGLVARELKLAGVKPSLLIVELTEATADADSDALAGTIAALHDLGVRLALDDFGAEHSGLSRLRRLPVDLLKIDRRFLEGVPDDPRACAILRAFVALGKAVGAQVVAEGVETEAQRDWVRACGCDHGQGWFFGRPTAAEPGRPPHLKRPPTPTPANTPARRQSRDTLGME